MNIYSSLLIPKINLKKPRRNLGLFHTTTFIKPSILPPQKKMTDFVSFQTEAIVKNGVVKPRLAAQEELYTNSNKIHSSQQSRNNRTEWLSRLCWHVSNWNKYYTNLRIKEEKIRVKSFDFWVLAQVFQQAYRKLLLLGTDTVFLRISGSSSRRR